MKKLIISCSSFFRLSDYNPIIQAYWRFVHCDTSCDGYMGLLFCCGEYCKGVTVYAKMTSTFLVKTEVISKLRVLSKSQN